MLWSWQYLSRSTLVVMLSIASAVQDERGATRTMQRFGRTNDPVCTLEQVPTCLLLPEVDARIDVHPSRYLLQRALDAAHFWRAYIREHRSCMSVEGRESDIVEVNEPDPRDTPARRPQGLASQSKAHSLESVRSYEHDGGPAADAPAPNDHDGALAYLRHALVTKERVVACELLLHELLVVFIVSALKVGPECDVPLVMLGLFYCRVCGRQGLWFAGSKCAANVLVKVSPFAVPRVLLVRGEKPCSG